jgi:septal ring factor EnvC (AmiA/AmiB activator)
MSQKKTVSVQFKAFSSEFESLLGPLSVFLVCYLHHLYFAHNIISSAFIASGLLSLVSVHAFRRTGLIISGLAQLAFLVWTAFDSTGMFLEQAIFSTSLLVALIASFTNQTPAEEKESGKELEELLSQKQQLWQQLFDARQEITSLYPHKLEKEQLQVELVAIQEKMQLVEHQLEASLLEKEEIANEKLSAERDIAKLLDHMREMAERPPLIQEKSTVDGKYRQLREQFDSKAQVLDQTRKELFFAQEEIEVLRRSFTELQSKAPSEEEKLLQGALAEASRELEKVAKTHEEELREYEGVIHELFQQLASLQSNK